MIGALALLLCSAQAGQGLDAKLASPVRDNVVELQVRTKDEGVRRALRAAPDETLRLHSDAGTVRADRVAPAVTDGRGVVTILAIDASGSFTRFLAPTYEVARSYVELRPLAERVGILLFGVERQDFATEVERDAIVAQLAKARSTTARQAETRLAEFVRQAAHRAAKEQPPSAGGLRQIILFTDGGEESQTWSVDEVADELIELNVRAHVVTFYRRGFGSRATALDNLSRLANRTGGVYIQATEADRASGRMGEIVAAASSDFDVAATMCGFAPGTTTTSLRAEAWVDGERVAWSDAVPLLGLSSAVQAPCPDDLERSVNGSKGDVDLDPHSAQSKGPTISQIAGWSCFPVGLMLLVVALVGGVLLAARSRRRDNAEPIDPIEPPATPTPPAPSAKPVVLAAPANLLDGPTPHTKPDAPRASLRVVRGEGIAGRAFAFRGNVLLVGAAQGNDVVADLPTISGHHARFEIFPSGDVYVSDSDSANGTWVQGARLSRGERRRLQFGDRVALSQAVVFELTPPEPTE